MPVRHPSAWRGAALAGALLLAAGCSKKEEPPAAVPSPAPAPAAQGPSASVGPLPERPEPPAEALPPREPVTGPVDPGPLPKDFQPGQPREVVLGLLGECAERRHFLPGGVGGLTVEVYQPREGECARRLGERHFTLVGGQLQRITPGLLPPPPPPAPAPPGL